MSQPCLAVPNGVRAPKVNGVLSTLPAGRCSASNSAVLRNCILCLIALAVPAFSTALLQMSMDQITAASTEIVQGTVSSSYTALSGTTIFTHYKIQVAQRWKGLANATTDVAIPGGSFKNLRQSFAGVPILETGHEYMLFLWQGAKGPNQPVGLNQGIFEVQEGTSGGLLVSRPATGETMLNSAHRAVVDHAIQMPLEQMHSRIAAVLRGVAAK